MNGIVTVVFLPFAILPKFHVLTAILTTSSKVLSLVVEDSTDIAATSPLESMVNFRATLPAVPGLLSLYLL